MMTEDNTAGRSFATIILWEAQDPINIGSVVRVCRNTGIDDLRLIRPAGWVPERVSISAPNSEAWLKQHVRIFETWEEAVSGVHELWALTARGRREGLTRHRLQSIARDLDGRASAGERVGFVFGREDHGLPNEVVDRCDGYITLETSPDYPSLNLAQAVLLVAHQLLMSFGEPLKMDAPPRRSERVTHDEVERMMAQAERALDAIDFFKGDQRYNVLRTIREVFVRAQLDKRELSTFWGVFKEVETTLERAKHRQQD